MIVFVQLLFCFIKEVFFGGLDNNDQDSVADSENGSQDQNPNQSQLSESVEEAVSSDSSCGQNGGHHLHSGLQTSASNSVCSQALNPPTLLDSDCLVSDSWAVEDKEEFRNANFSQEHSNPAVEATITSDNAWPQGYGGVNSMPSKTPDPLIPTAQTGPEFNYTAHLVSEQEWLDEFESLFYAENMMSDLKSLIRKALSLSKDPFSFALYTARHADFDLFKYSNKKSLPYLIMIEFESWLQERIKGRSVDEIQTLGLEPTNHHKDLALEMVVTERLYLFESVKRVYKLDSGDNDFLDQHLRFLLHSKKKYKEAATFAYKLHLQRAFEISEILVPLVILDKLQLAESYLAGCPALQKEFLMLLDAFCGMTDEELENIVETTISPKPKDHRLKVKTLVKLSERLVKLFHLKAEDYPNVYREKNVNGLKYLLHKKYSERGSSSRKWDDMLETAIGNQQWLQEELVQSLCQLGDIEEAARWTQYYDLPLDIVPRKVQDLVQERRQYFIEEEDWEGEMGGTAVPQSQATSPYRSPSPTMQYLPLSLPLDRILLVRDARALEACRRTISMPGRTVGFDAEWRPVMCRAGSDDRLAIIQLATWSEVFILDMMALPENAEDEQLRRFAIETFANPQVLKLGYGVESDFQILTSSCPPFKDALDKASRFVDLCPLSKEILRLPSVKQKIRTKGRLPMDQRGLTELAYLTLGKPLDKTYQVSDWERRPLSTEQLRYAALDAFCLLEAYEVLKAWVRESGIAVDMEPRLEWQKPEKDKRKDSRRRQPKPGMLSEVPVNPVRRGKPISPRSLSVVVDTMLQGLGRQLRCCGVDVAILENGSDHAKTAEIAKRENRAILTCGTPYNKLRSQVPLGMCMCVPTGNTRQQVAAVFKYFNVKITAQDIFSRCQVCNGHEYIEILPPAMRLALDIFYGRIFPPADGHVPIECPINLRQLTIAGDVRLKLAPLPEGVVDSVKVFFCCANCGKIFWEGGHHKKVLDQFSHVLDDSSGVWRK